MGSSFDILVIGGGHAGAEAAWAAAGAGARVALVTMDPARIGQMSCNPAIGGLGKGQMVREVDALGGLMGLAIDASGIMFKELNTSKGAAVRGPRAQADKYAYAAEVQRLLSTRPLIDVIAGTVEELLVEDGRCVGVRLAAGARAVTPDAGAIEANLAGNRRAVSVYPSPSAVDDGVETGRDVRAGAVVLTSGTFMRGLMHTGERRTPGGRFGEGTATGMSGALQRLGFELGRLKTGTPPRLARGTIDWDALPAQTGDDVPRPFSDRVSDRVSDRFPVLAQTSCRLTHTTPEVHAVIRANLHRAPMYSGQVEADTGPRYCPSIEDKVVRFADRGQHHVFLEPESLFTDEIYCNGISTSLPEDVQQAIVRGMPGCARAEIQRYGYAVEYDMVWPHQIDATLMTKRLPGLFLAGQINCTTGYEEAAGQGLWAGVNATRYARADEMVRLARSDAYIGVMLDDLVTKTPREPYRMFTSRAEHRLRLRADNADERLTPLARSLGLIDDEHWRAYDARATTLASLRARLHATRDAHRSLWELARRPQTTAVELRDRLAAAGNADDGAVADLALLERLVTEARYDGYIARQDAEIRRQRDADGRPIPAWLTFDAVPGLRLEAAEVLTRFCPQTLGQAGRLAGVNPADVTLLAVVMKRGPAVAAV